jgi:voltage-gated potassium channel Kch
MRKTLKDIRERLRYLIDRAFDREFAGQLMLFGVLVVVVTMLGMTATFFGLFSIENRDVSGIPTGIDRGFWDSMWWSLHQVLRLRGLERMYGATGPVLAYALFLSVMGLAVFGILVSVINNTMRSRIESLRKGETLVKERGHVLVLGWNNKGVSVLLQIARLDPGARVVILAPIEVDDLRKTLRVAGIEKEPITVVLRSGKPSYLSELERVAVNKSSSVIILSTDDDDSESTKTLVLLASKNDWPGKIPTLTSEIALEQNYELAKIAARERLQIVSSSRVISKVIVQTIRNPGLAIVYKELFSAGGNSIFVERVAACTDRTIEEVAYGIGQAIPIGIAWQEEKNGAVRHSAFLNPEADYEVAEEEKLVMMSRGLPVTFNPPDSPFESDLCRDGGRSARVPQRVLLIGWTDIFFDIVSELNAHALLGTEVTVLSNVATEEAHRRLEAYSLTHLALEFREGDAVNEAVFEGVELGSYDTIIVLADENACKGDVDTHTLRVMLRISNLRKNDKTRAHTVIELMDETNRDLMAGLGVDDIVVSPDVVSAQLAQIARQQVLGPIYRELLSAGGIEISLRSASDYVTPGVPCRFADFIYATQQQTEIALGLRLASDGGKVLLNPARDITWTLEADDQVIVLAQQVYA